MYTLFSFTSHLSQVNTHLGQVNPVNPPTSGPGKAVTIHLPESGKASTIHLFRSGRPGESSRALIRCTGDRPMINPQGEWYPQSWGLMTGTQRGGKR